MWLNPNICDSLLDPERKYHIFRYDRSARRGGGVCIMVNREFNAISVPISSNYFDVELVCVDVLYCNAKCRLICVYRSTDSSHQSELFSAHLVPCLETRETHWCYLALLHYW